MKKRWYRIPILALVFGCMTMGTFAAAAETEGNETQINETQVGETLNLGVYEYENQTTSDEIVYRDVIIEDYVVYQYKKDTDSFIAQTIDHTDKTLPKTLKLEIKASVCGRPVREVNRFLIDTEPDMCKVISLTLPDTLRQKELVFDFEHGGAWLKTIIFNGEIQKTGLSADPGASALKNVALPASSVSTGCFAGNSKLTKAALPGNLKRVDNLAFADCKALKTMRLPDGVTQIGKRAFSGCRKLELYVPASVKKIGRDAFGTAKAGRIKKLYCVKNSAAHKFAKKNRISYTLVNKKPAKRKITGLTPEKKAITMTVGEKRTIGVTVKPFYAGGQKLNWKSSRAEVAEVDGSGTVTAKSEGETTITVKAKSGKKATVKVTVKAAL